MPRFTHPDACDFCGHRSPVRLGFLPAWGADQVQWFCPACTQKARLEYHWPEATHHPAPQPQPAAPLDTAPAFGAS